MSVLSVNDPEAADLAHALAARTGETVDEAVVKALRERLARTPERTTHFGAADELLAIALECAALPEFDSQSADEIIGYDDIGLPR